MGGVTLATLIAEVIVGHDTERFVAVDGIWRCACGIEIEWAGRVHHQAEMVAVLMNSLLPAYDAMRDTELRAANTRADLARAEAAKWFNARADAERRAREAEVERDTKWEGVGWERVGWWWWFDGDLTKTGLFRYDHTEKGVSVPVVRRVGGES